MRQSRNSLRDVVIFRRLSAPARAAAEGLCSFRSYPRGGTIIHPRDSTREVYFLIAGRARVIRYSATGKPVSFRDIGAGEMFGEFAAVDGRPRSTAVEVLEAARVGAIAAGDFLALMLAEPLLMLSVLVHVIAQVRAITERVYEYDALGVAERICAEIVRLARAGEVVGRQVRICPFPTHREIASRISTHREAVARQMSVLAKAKLIERRGRTLVVLDLVRLERMLDGARWE